MTKENIFTYIEKDILELLRAEQLNNPLLDKEYKGSIVTANCSTNSSGESVLSISSSKSETPLDSNTIRLYARIQDDILILSQIFLLVEKQGTGTKICNILIDLARKNNLKQFRVFHAQKPGSLALCKSLKMIRDGETNNYYLNL